MKCAVNRRRSLTRRAAAVVLVTAAAIVSWVSPIRACSLEPAINGGFSVSHPRALDVAVAVADARSKGLLPEFRTETVPNDVQLNRMMRDLIRLQARLDDGRKDMTERPRSFSLVLIGPGLWSHFLPSSSALLARYHTTGPIAGKVNVVTHHSVLRALLDGDMTTEQAESLGMLVFSDGDTVIVEQLFALSLTPRTQYGAATVLGLVE